MTPIVLRGAVSHIRDDPKYSLLGSNPGGTPEAGGQEEGKTLIISAAPQPSLGAAGQDIVEQATLGREYEVLGRVLPQKHATPNSTPANGYDSAKQADAHHSRVFKDVSNDTVKGSTLPVIV